MSPVDITHILALPEDHPSLYCRLPDRYLPQKVYIEMDSNGVLAEEYAADVVSMDVWNWATLRLFEVPADVDVQSLKAFVKEHLDLIQKIHDGHRVVSRSDGSRHGSLTDRAKDALEKLQAAAEKDDAFSSWFIMKPDEYLAPTRDSELRRDVETHGDALRTAQAYLDNECPETNLWIDGGVDALAEEIERRMQAMEEEEDEEEEGED
jgi:hypothetical protein